MDDIYVIDHISYLLSKEDEEKFLSFLHTQVKDHREDRVFTKPHITVAYSPTPIDNFPLPNNEFEMERVFPLKEKHSISISPDENYKYRLFTDPYGSLNLILDISSHKQVLSQHEYFKTRGAIWPFGSYYPFIILEKDTPLTKEDLVLLPSLDQEYTFTQIRYKRFAEKQEIFH